MRVGRLCFGLAQGRWSFGKTFALCTCTLIDLGPFYATWLRGACAEDPTSK
jgi:hypothetical protein